jgi:hypothetical protein
VRSDSPAEDQGLEAGWGERELTPAGVSLSRCLASSQLLIASRFNFEAVIIIHF